MAGPLLDIRQLQVAYGQVTALHDFSCTLAEGEIVALVGSNGAGKTTFLRCVSGLLQAKRGSVEFAGEDITRLQPNERVERGLVMIPEGRLIFSDFTVEENLKIGAISARARGFVEQGIEEAYQLFPRLKERRGQPGGTLSGGEQQMLAVARGLMARPRILLLDEPTLGLAPIVADLIFETINQLRDKGLTLLIVEQNVTRTLEVADQAFVLENGIGILQGKAAELMHDPRIRESYLGM
jgi:branched-chain amino acid transport system ATP-binding protein